MPSLSSPLPRLLTAFVLLAAALSAWPVPVLAFQDPAVYDHRATRDLVTVVNQAAALFAQKGEAAFEEFSRPGSRWLNRDRYIFIYDMDGVCVFHPVTPSHVGKNWLNSRDATGKPVHRMLLRKAANPDKPYGWVHYHRPPPQGLFPMWKSTYVVGVRDPSGKLHALCSGLYNMRLERRFIIDLVDRAAGLIARQGAGAFSLLTDPAGPYVFAETYVYVLSPQGDLLVDPAFPHGPGRNALNYTDAAGRHFILEILERIRGRESAWGMYLWPRPGEITPSKKLMYLRRVEFSGQGFLVGSDLFAIRPVWMP